MDDANLSLHQNEPRTVALIGPYGGGKTTLCGTLLQAAGAAATRRAASARTHAPTYETKLSHCTFLGDAWAILDCPGSPELAYETACALAVADFAVVVVDPEPARAILLRPTFRMLEAEQLPFMIFINKIDTLEGASDAAVDLLIEALQAETKVQLIPRQMPIRENGIIVGYIDLLSERAYRYRAGAMSEKIAVPASMTTTEQAAHDAVIDMLADHNDILLEQVINEDLPTPAELYSHFRLDLGKQGLAGVMLGAAERFHGVQRLWKALRHDVAGPSVTATRQAIAAHGPPLAQIFKTTYGNSTGKLSFARIWRGTFRDGTAVNVNNNNGSVRIGGITRFSDHEAQKVGLAEMGEVVVLGRLQGVPTGAILGTAEQPLAFPSPPPPLHVAAIAAVDRKDDVKLSSALEKLLESDLSLGLVRNPETGDTLLAGQGEVHLNHAIEQLGALAGFTIRMTQPRVPFKETIRRPVHQHTRVKRQTGGHGQFADVKLYIEPLSRGTGFRFTDRVVGGAIPRQFIAAVSDAAKEATQRGPLGYPVVDVAVTLVDGGFHAVDSSDMAFRSATRIGMMEGLAKADPILLEPIHRVTVSAPTTFTTNVLHLLTSMRGQILGFSERPEWANWDDTEAVLPEAELHGLITELRSQTAGLGTFVYRFDHLGEAPQRLAEKVIQEITNRVSQ